MEPQPSEGAPQPGRSSGRSWIAEGMIIAAITLIAYMMTVFYEAGFCSYFNIPFGYISINPTIVLSIGWVRLGIVLGAYCHPNGRLSINDSRKRDNIAFCL
jgi:hypothetical protein